MQYALEELIVDSIVSYLGLLVKGELAVYASPTTDELQYPCVCVRATGISTIGSQWQDQQKATVEVAVMSEAADEIDSAGNTVVSARIRNSRARQSVLTALTVKDSDAVPANLASLGAAQDLPKGLAAWLTAQQIPGVWIQSALPAQGGPLCVMEVDAERRLLVSVITLSVIAQAAEI